MSPSLPLLNETGTISDTSVITNNMQISFEYVDWKAESIEVRTAKIENLQQSAYWWLGKG